MITKKNFTIYNIQRFFTAYWRNLIFLIGKFKAGNKLLSVSFGEDFYQEHLYIQEQVVYRLYRMSKHKTGFQCLSKGECLHCGCSIPGLQSANDPCEGGCYTRLLSSKEWIRYKEINKFSINLKTKEVIWD